MTREVKMNDALSALRSIGKAPKNGEWWKTLIYPDTPNFEFKNLLSCARSALFGMSLNGGPTVRESYFVASIDPIYKSDETKKLYITAINKYIIDKLKGKLIYHIYSPYRKEGNYFYVFPGGAFQVDVEMATVSIITIGTSNTHMQLASDMVEGLPQR